MVDLHCRKHFDLYELTAANGQTNQTLNELEYLIRLCACGNRELRDLPWLCWAEHFL